MTKSQDPSFDRHRAKIVRRLYEECRTACETAFAELDRLDHAEHRQHEAEEELPPPKPDSYPAYQPTAGSLPFLSVAVIERHPEGITAAAIAEELGAEGYEFYVSTQNPEITPAIRVQWALDRPRKRYLVRGRPEMVDGRRILVFYPQGYSQPTPPRPLPVKATQPEKPEATTVMPTASLSSLRMFVVKTLYQSRHEMLSATWLAMLAQRVGYVPPHGEYLVNLIHQELKGLVDQGTVRCMSVRGNKKYYSLIRSTEITVAKS